MANNLPHDRRKFLSHTGTLAASLGASLTVGSGALTWSSPVSAAAPSKPRIKVGQIGVRHAHATKLSAYRASPDYEVIGIVESDVKAREQAQSQAAFRDLPWMTEEQLLNLEGLDVVLVETAVRDSLVTAERCLRANKHIHLDKPAGESFADFRRIIELARSQKLLIQMGYMFRYNPAIVLLREFLQRGWLGEVFEVHTVISKVVDPASRKELAEYPGGMMFELGCHVIDLVINIIGQPRTITPYKQHVSTLDDRLWDNMLAVFETDHCIATVKSSAVEVEGGNRRHLVVCGSEGTFHIQPLDRPAATLVLNSKRGEYRAGSQSLTFPKFTRYEADAADMAKVVRGEKETDFSLNHDLLVQRSILLASGLSI